MFLHSSCDKIHFDLSLMMLKELYYCYTKTTDTIMYNNAVLKIATIIIVENKIVMTGYLITYLYTCIYLVLLDS